MRPMSLISAIHQHYAWSDPISWDSSFKGVLRIRIHMFLGLLDPDPDPLVRGMDPDPDPSITMQNY
jgi:hypothetical protein